MSDPYINRVFVCGTLNEEPELRQTKKGFSVCTVILEVKRQWTDKEEQEKEEVSDIEVDVFGRCAENLCQYLHKGDPVFFEGHLKLEVWEQNGERCARMIVVAENMQFMPNKEGSGGKRRTQQTGERPSEE